MWILGAFAWLGDALTGNASKANINNTATVNGSLCLGIFQNPYNNTPYSLEFKPFY
jgi:hypothetical protein